MTEVQFLPARCDLNASSLAAAHARLGGDLAMVIYGPDQAAGADGIDRDAYLGVLFIETKPGVLITDFSWVAVANAPVMLVGMW